MAERAHGDAFAWPIRVYYEDTDAGGVVYHAGYLRFLERARTEWLRACGVDQSRLAAEHGVLFAVVAMELAFRAPARLDDELLATCTLIGRGGASLEFSQQLVRARDDVLLVSARVRAACLEASSFKPRGIPEQLVLER